MLAPRILSALPALAAIALPAAGQRPETLGPPAATFAEPFSNLTGIRELSDGRVLIADELERHVSFIDFGAGTLQQIGREGEGPSEYATPSGLLALPDDETLLLDFGNMRLTHIDRTGKLTDSWPMMLPDGTLIRPSGSDAEGRLYFSTAGVITMLRRGAEGANQTRPDSAAVQRMDPATGHIDTVGMLKIPVANVSTRRLSSGGMSFTGAMSQPFAPADAWGVAPDGRVAIARAEPYRLDWYRDGRATAGPHIDYQPIRITHEEKEAWADRQAEQRATMRVTGISGGRSQAFQMPRPNLDEVDFPDYKPPFERRNLRVTPWGEVWIERTRPHDEMTTLYDIFDGTGRRVKQLLLPEERQLIGFGHGSVFLIRTDQDDLQWLEKYAYETG